MADETFEVKGLRELGEAFALLAADIQGKIGRAVTNAGAQVVKKRAIAKAPIAKEDYVVQAHKGDPGVKVPRGNLRKKIAVKYLGTRTGLTSEHIVFVRAKRKDGYANRIGILNEFGTVKMGPKAFMRPAIDEGKYDAAEAMKARLKQRIDKANEGGK